MKSSLKRVDVLSASGFHTNGVDVEASLVKGAAILL